MIKFTNTQAERAGKGIIALRQRSGLSLEQLAAEVNRSVGYVRLLEEGHERKIDRAVLEHISVAVGVRRRGTSLTDEQLKNLFIYAVKNGPPKLI